MTRRNVPDMTRPENRMGLSQRLREKREAAIGKTVLLPVYVLPQIEDKK